MIGAMLGCIFSLCIGCCGKHQSLSYYKTKQIEKLLDQSSQNPVNNLNFLALSSYIMTEDGVSPCFNDEDTQPHLCNDTLFDYTFASGYIIKKDVINNQLYFLTAAHWCDSTMYITAGEGISLPMLGYYATYLGERYRINIIEYDADIDVCLAKFNTKYAYKAKNINIAGELPLIGEKVYTQSAPLGISDDHIRNNFEGKFSGCTDVYCMFTIPATFGSSGSAVINEKGEIISIIAASVIPFPFIATGPKLKELKEFLETYL